MLSFFIVRIVSIDIQNPHIYYDSSIFECGRFVIFLSTFHQLFFYEKDNISSVLFIIELNFNKLYSTAEDLLSFKIPIQILKDNISSAEDDLFSAIEITMIPQYCNIFSAQINGNRFI